MPQALVHLKPDVQSEKNIILPKINEINFEEFKKILLSDKFIAQKNKNNEHLNEDLESQITFEDLNGGKKSA